MGCDIYGWVEIKAYPDEDNWKRALNIEAVLGRNYAVFGVLFGVRNSTGIAPLAAGRGLPADTNEAIRADYNEWGANAHSASFVTLAELDAYDWEQEGQDECIYAYRQNDLMAWERQ